MGKILRIGIDARLWQETGVGRYMRNLVLQLQKIDQDNSYILFVLPKDKTAIQKILTNPHFTLVEAPLHWHSLEEQIKFPQIIKREQVDLMHFSYFSVPFFYNKPFIVTIHDLIPYYFPTGKASTLPRFLYYAKYLSYRLILRHAVQQAQRVIVPSQATEKELKKSFHLSSAQIAVTPEGYDASIHTSTTKSPLSFPYFLYVGNAYPHKNLENLLKGFHLFKNKNQNSLKLVLVGKKDYFYNRLQAQVKQLHLDDEVIYAGFVSDEALASYYDHAVALLAPSFMEGFGLPVLEAMHRGIAIGAADIPAFHEVGEDIPVYFQPLQPESIAESLEKLEKIYAQHTNKKQKGQELAKKFSWEKMAEKTKAAYESCVGI